MAKQIAEENLNWAVPKALADRFNEAASGERFNQKQRWMAASAAMLMFIEADDELRRKYCDRIKLATDKAGVAELAEKTDAPPPAGKIGKSAGERRPKRRAAEDRDDGRG